jgi:chromate reductase, NAD(P)H dehydrogenase (quinone)
MRNTDPVHILAISGSLRRASSNKAVVDAAARLAPRAVEVSVYDGLADIPAFNPDLDGDIAPTPVTRFRALLQACDAVLIASPEYAYGVPGALKNALDWIVGSGELADKPIAVINTSARATHAWSSLVDTLSVMSARVVLDASITLRLGGRSPDADAIAADAAMAIALKAAIQVLAADAREAQAA